VKERKRWTDTQTKDRVKMRESKERLCGEDLNNKPGDSVQEEGKERKQCSPSKVWKVRDPDTRTHAKQPFQRQ
jgi:hypothetical protein